MPRKYKNVCFICKTSECLKGEKYKFIYNSKYSIYDIDFDRFGKKKYLCCKCTIIIDNISYNEVSDITQCSCCSNSTKFCKICETNKCHILSNYDVGYEGYADEDGYYCCKCVSENSDTWNSDRFCVYPCDYCKNKEKKKEKKRKEKKLQKIIKSGKHKCNVCTINIENKKYDDIDRDNYAYECTKKYCDNIKEKYCSKHSPKCKSCNTSICNECQKYKLNINYNNIQFNNNECEICDNVVCYDCLIVCESSCGYRTPICKKCNTIEHKYTKKYEKFYFCASCTNELK